MRKPSIYVRCVNIKKGICIEITGTLSNAKSTIKRRCINEPQVYGSLTDWLFQVRYL